MNKVITDPELDQLLNFIGYGRIDADLWFLGYEESAGKESKIRSRLKLEQVEDCAQAHEILDVPLQQFAENNLLGAWRGMSQVMLRLENKAPTEENLQDYLADQLGHADGSTLICELMPLPMQPGEDWPYSAQLPQYGSREAYYAEVKPLRVDFFKELIQQQLPKVIIAFGQKNWLDYEEIFKDYKLKQNGNFMIGWDANTVVILCDHLSDEFMSENYDELVSLILENSLSIEIAKPTGPIPLSKAELARQKKEAARKASAAKRKPSAKHNPADPYCVCAYCLGYEND